ncbi:hypothetical protein FRB94_012035 [Tulasnella sp. JGI-2019a]|nr:hypothetical protein FRB94_012035 [Tulasnella sp. JGI-2019a]
MLVARSSTPIPSLLWTVVASILEVALLCFAGWILARMGMLIKTTQNQLNRINIVFFTPALIFSKVAFTLTPQKLKELWIIPIIFIIVTGVSAGVAWLMAYLLGLKRTQRNFAMAASMFSNSNSLPIPLMKSLVVTVHGLNHGEGDNQDAMIGRALTYLILYYTLGMMLRWSYGVRLLSQADDEFEPDIVPVALSPLNWVPVPTQPAAGSTGTEAAPNNQRVSAPSLPTNWGPLYLQLWNRMKRSWKAFNGFMTPPVWAAIASLVVACIKPVQDAIEHHVQFVKDGIDAAGDCCIPVTLIVLGAYFVRPPREIVVPPSSVSGEHHAGNGVSSFPNVGSSAMQNRSQSPNKGERKTVFAAIIARMVLTPAVVLPAMSALAMYDSHTLMNDPVFYLSMILVASAPPALTLGQITQAAAGDAFERLISQTLFWSYCAFTPPLTIVYVVLGLLVSKR